MSSQSIQACRSQAAIDAHAAARVLLDRLAHDDSNAFIEVFEEAFLDTVLDEANRSHGQLAGVHFAVKDNIRVAGHAAQAGTPALDSEVSTRDAEVVAALRKAGAIPVGSVNMHELALGTTSNNAHFGAARNPVDLTRTPGGSSGGTAAAIASGFVPFGLSSDTGGSSRIPAAYCGLVGLRPTHGRYSADGVISISPTRDTVGVMATSVADVALVDGIITGETEAPKLELSELRLGLPRPGFFDDLDPEVATVVEFAFERLADAGAVFVETEVIDSHVKAARGFEVVAYETPRAIASLLLPDRASRAHPDELTGEDLEALHAFAARIASPDVAGTLKHFLDEPISAQAYAEALSVRQELRDAYAATFERDALDALLYPTVPIVAQPVGAETVRVNGVERDLFQVSIRNTDPGSFAGQPSLTIPIPRARGTLPVGLGIEGKLGKDRSLLAVSACIEEGLTII